MAHQVVGVRLRLVDELNDGVDDLAEPVRRHVRRHPDGDPGRTVDEQVREARREDGRLAARLVVVGDEVDRVHVDVPQHLGRETREPAFRVAHRGGGVVVDVPEVPLPVDERVAQRKRLRHADEGVVDRLVAVRVVVTHDITDDAGRLEPGAIRLQAGLVHCIEHAAVDRLQAVTGVGQSARDDDAHRIVDEARAHLLLELSALDAAGAERLDDVRHPGTSHRARSAR